MRKILIAILTLVFLSGIYPAFAQQDADPVEAPKFKIVTTFSILQDLTKNIVGKKAEIFNLIPVGADLHDYKPNYADMQNIAKADIIMANGVGLEPWLDRAMKAAGFKGTLILGPRTQDIEGLNKDQKLSKEKYGSSSFDHDPHLFPSAYHARHYAARVSKEMSRLDPENKEYYVDRYKAYGAELMQLENWAASEFNKIPPSKRKMMTMHDSMRYFADHYKIEYYSVVGLSTEHQPSAAEIAAAIDVIKRENIKALFPESTINSGVMQKIASETGVPLGGVLFTETLNTVKDDADTYINMYRRNVNTILDAMRQGGA